MSKADENTPTIDVVMTTIGDGTALRAHTALLRAVEHSVRQRVRLVIIPDRRTPPGLYRAAEDAVKHGINILCPNLEEQEQFLSKLRAGPLVSLDSDNRRNIGYLFAWRDQRDVVISIDDDNIPMSPDFYQEHTIVAAGPTPQLMTSATGNWFNICDLMVNSPPDIWPRGYPYYARNPAEVSELPTEDTEIAVNAGVWLGDPDVDGITRTAMHPIASDYAGRSVVLAQDTWSPINTQNTAVRLAAIPAYYFPKLKVAIDGTKVDRFADIFSGLFVQACAKHLGESVRLGSPPVQHNRNAHDTLQDIALELPLIRLSEDLAPLLVSVTLEGGNYCHAYLSLASALDEHVEDMKGPLWSPAAKAFFHSTTYLMRLWITVIRRIQPNTS